MMKEQPIVQASDQSACIFYYSARGRTITKHSFQARFQEVNDAICDDVMDIVVYLKSR